MTINMNMGIVDIKPIGSTDERCRNCFIKTYQRLFDKFDVDNEQRNQFDSFFNDVFERPYVVSSPEIQRLLNHEFCKIINVSNPFQVEKKASNTLAISMYQEWRPKVLVSDDPFDLALRLSIAGNIMDYGSNCSFDIHSTIQDVLEAKFPVDHSGLLREKIKQAKSILYLGDNAGEIVFDKLFIEIMMHNEVVYAVRGAPILNDATIEDAEEVGMCLSADVISNGYDAPSTVLHSSSREFLDLYNSADLIISKGQGNFEELAKYKDPRIFHLLMAKCDVIAEMLQVEKGSFIVYSKNE